MMNSKMDIAEKVLGRCGRMICGSKSEYAHKHPEHLVVFNANVCLSDGKIWYGDLDVTRDEAKLQELAEALGETVFVLREMDARFHNEVDPKLEAAVWSSDV